ncbi:MAG: class I SAM-dependent methyltransferase [Chloroflexota bacterium]|nr:class I SAM-dependent methyltransferase [Chloroflexota bacterium]
MTEWWQDLFDEKYLKLFREARDPLRTAQEIEGITALLGLNGVQEGAEILDLACGYGRISVPLAQIGYSMTGLDLSTVLLDSARETTAQSDQDVSWQQGDMRELPEQWTGRFDAVINIFSAFGYFEDPAENQRVLSEVQRVLKPGGVFIVDLTHRDYIMSSFRPTDWFEIDDLLVCTSREFDPISGMNQEYWLWADERGERHMLSFRVHVYTATELTRMLSQAELEPVAYYGALAAPPDLLPFQALSRRLVVVSRKDQPSLENSDGRKE